MDAHESGDTSGFAAMLREDVRVTMPPLPEIYDGIEALQPLWERAFDTAQFGEWKLVAARVNRMPAAASYLRREGETEFRPFKLDVLRVEGDRIAEITTFGAQPFERLGLPATL
jgi:RNA polymerase sigma-70 factor (ECF subfamily)